MNINQEKENFLDFGYTAEPRQNGMDCRDISGAKPKLRGQDNVTMDVAGKKIEKTHIDNVWSMGQEYERIMSKEERIQQGYDFNGAKRNQFGQKLIP